MAKSSNQKLKLIYLMKILLEKTDETHSITMSEIIDSLDAYNISAERKSLYNDIENLRVYGLDIIGEQQDRTFSYHVGNRQFELAELKLLVDSIQSAKFITAKKSNELIKKIEGFASKYEASQLDRQVFVAGRVKTMNESIYYNVDRIHTAIAENSRITFQYFQWNVNKEMELRHDGALYEVSPWSLSCKYYIDKPDDIKLDKEMKSIFDRISEFRKKKTTKKCDAVEDADIEIDESAVESFDVESMQKTKATDSMSSTLATNRNIESLMGQMDETFSQRLLRLIGERGMTDSEAYNKAYVDRRHFSKIRKDVNYTPNKKTVLAFAIALELSIDEAKDLLNSAGFALSRSSKTDIIVAYFLQNKIYDMFEINEILDAYGQPIFE